MARPSEYNIELCNEICERISLGEHIKDVLDSDKKRFPTLPTWSRWKRENDELFNLYTRSIQDKAEMIIWEINQTMQDLKKGLIDSASARVIIDTYKWMAAKFYPKMFGDKLDIDHKTNGKDIVQPIFGSNPLNGE